VTAYRDNSSHATANSSYNICQVKTAYFVYAIKLQFLSEMCQLLNSQMYEKTKYPHHFFFLPTEQVGAQVASSPWPPRLALVSHTGKMEATTAIMATPARWKPPLPSCELMLVAAMG
jgi:hypothetical protein